MSQGVSEAKPGRGNRAAPWQPRILSDSDRPKSLNLRCLNIVDRTVHVKDKRPRAERRAGSFRIENGKRDRAHSMSDPRNQPCRGKYNNLVKG